jgi:O-glycosyl hydrolase
MKNLIKVLGIIVVTAVISIAFFGCAQDASDGSSTDEGQNAAVPNITVQPTSRNYEPGDAIIPLAVSATVSDGGVLSYKWYQNTEFSNKGGQEIPGATGLSYEVPQTVTGDTYYYAVVTNFNENAKRNKTVTTESSIARIRVQAGSTAAMPDKSITINADDRQQYVRGFGGMSSVLFSDGGGSPDINAEELDILFNKDGKIRLNILRIIMPPDLDRHVANQITGTATQDNSDYFDLVKLVNRNGGYVFACPWTPPAHFKTNNSVVGGGHVKPELYPELAQFFKTYLDKMAAKGAPLYAISVQNEPNYPAPYDGCDYTVNEMRDFIKVLGPVIIDTPGYGGGRPISKIKLMTGESANSPLINNASLDDPVSAGYIDIIPRHYYGDVQVKYNKALDMGKEVWQTEYSDTTGQASSLYVYYSTWSWVWQFLNYVDCSQRLNNESAFVWWYSKRFYGLIGDDEYSGPPVKTITNRGYALAHYARFATDTTRVGITAEGISSINNTAFNAQSYVPKCTAYESMDKNSYSLVIFTPALKVNSSGEGTRSVDLGDILINLPAGFTATSAYALKTNINDKLADELVVLNADGKSALINVPANTIMSVKFSR